MSLGTPWAKSRYWRRSSRRTLQKFSISDQPSQPAINPHTVANSMSGNACHLVRSTGGLEEHQRYRKTTVIRLQVALLTPSGGTWTGIIIHSTEKFKKLDEVALKTWPLIYSMAINFDNIAKNFAKSDILLSGVVVHKPSGQNHRSQNKAFCTSTNPS